MYETYAELMTEILHTFPGAVVTTLDHFDDADRPVSGELDRLVVLLPYRKVPSEEGPPFEGDTSLVEEIPPYWDGP